MTDTGNTAIGLVTDDFIARQVIDRLYEELRQLSFRPDREDRTPDFPVGMWAAIDEYGWDQWSVNNRNGATPVFRARTRYMWNSVPSTLVNWNMGDTPDAYSQFPGDQPSSITIVPETPTVTNG
jgi:hypothetical protein